MRREREDVERELARIDDRLVAGALDRAVAEHEPPAIGVPALGLDVRPLDHVRAPARVPPADATRRDEGPFAARAEHGVVEEGRDRQGSSLSGMRPSLPQAAASDVSSLEVPGASDKTGPVGTKEAELDTVVDSDSALDEPVAHALPAPLAITTSNASAAIAMTSARSLVPTMQ
jgi:hypothetical protein